jgi:dTMP kinase
LKTHYQYPGYLIAIEGIDGAGKTTQAHHVQALLQARKLPVVRTKEPTSGYWGQLLRDSALTGRLSLDEEIETFIKDRMEHVDAVIRPELESGKIVIADRYYFSNMAYQGARGVNPQEIMARNETFAPEPDLLVILDLEPKAGLERVRTRGDRANHFEKTGALRKARQIFLDIKKSYLYRIDATQGVEQIRNLILTQFSAKVAERIAQSKASPGDHELQETLKLFGRDQV